MQELGRDVGDESWLGNEGKRPASVDKEHPVSVNLCYMLAVIVIKLSAGLMMGCFG